jgi:hypothetical protein
LTVTLMFKAAFAKEADSRTSNEAAAKAIAIFVLFIFVPS